MMIVSNYFFCQLHKDTPTEEHPVTYILILMEHSLEMHKKLYGYLICDFFTHK